MNLKNLPDNLVYKILGFFQTEKIIKLDNNLPDYQINQLILAGRKNLINGSGIKTDLRTIVAFSEVCKHFNYIVKKSNVGKLLLSIHLNSDKFNLSLNNKLEHISYCSDSNCKNICHYVNKDIKYSDPFKKIAIATFVDIKNNKSLTDKNIIDKFKYYLTYKQIESYYKIKKIQIN